MTPCEHHTLPGGTAVIVCMRRMPAKRCKYCYRPSTKSCDYPLTGAKSGKTCDVPMCDRCAHHVEPDTDYCQAHARIIKEQETKP